MRRPATVSVIAGLLLLACAAPEFDLRPRFRQGEVREYRLVADATVRISGGGNTTAERTHLLATTRLEVLETSSEATTLQLTIIARELTRDDKAAEPPGPQMIRLTVSSDGRISKVTTSGAAPADLSSADVEDLVPLIGPPVPPRRVHLADRWDAAPPAIDASPTPSPGVTAAPLPSPTTAATPSASPTAEGRLEARLAALRVVDRYDCAIVALSARRPVVRERVISGTPLRLEGLEFSAGEIAFAFREGLPITVRSQSEARLGISSVAGRSGSVVIETTTSLTLVRRIVP